MEQRDSRNQENSVDSQAIDIYLFSNGQEYCPPRKYHLSYEDLSSWDSTLKHLARLQYGAMHSNMEMYTLDGEKVTSPADVCHGAAYVAVVAPDQFMDTGYRKYLMKATRSWEKRQERRQEILSTRPDIGENGFNKTQEPCDDPQFLKNDYNSTRLNKSVTIPSTSDKKKGNISRLQRTPGTKSRLSTSPSKARSAINKETSLNCRLKVQKSPKSSYDEKLNKIPRKLGSASFNQKTVRQDMQIDNNNKSVKMDYKKVVELKNNNDVRLPKNVVGTHKRQSELESQAPLLVNEILYSNEFASIDDALNPSKDATLSTTNRDTIYQNDIQTTFPVIYENSSIEHVSANGVGNKMAKTHHENGTRINDSNADSNRESNEAMAREDPDLNKCSNIKRNGKKNSEYQNLNIRKDMHIKISQSSRTVSTTSANSSEPLLTVRHERDVVKLKFSIDVCRKPRSNLPDVEKLEKGSQAHLKIDIGRSSFQCNEDTDTMLDAVENVQPQNCTNMWASNYPRIVAVQCSTGDANGAPAHTCVSKESNQYYVLVPAINIKNNRCSCAENVSPTEAKPETAASIESEMKTEILTVNEYSKLDEENDINNPSVQQRVANIEKCIKELVTSVSSSKTLSVNCGAVSVTDTEENNTPCMHPMTSTCKMRPHSESLKELLNIRRTDIYEPDYKDTDVCQSKRDSDALTKANPRCDVNDEATQTDWRDTILEATLTEDNHYTFNLPDLETLKRYNL